MDSWSPGAGFVDEGEVLVGISEAGSPDPTTIGEIVRLRLPSERLKERLSWVLALCAREYPHARRAIDVRALKFCPHCGSEACGFIGFVLLDEKLLGGAQAVVGSCSSCGELN
jgi:hypothetical protein